MRSPALVSRAHMRFGLTQESCPEHNRKFCSSVFKFLPYAHIQTHIYWQRVVIMMSHLLAPQQSCNPKCTIVSVFAANLMELRDTQLKCRGNCLKALFGKIKTTLPSLYFQLWLHCYWPYCRSCETYFSGVNVRMMLHLNGCNQFPEISFPGWLSTSFLSRTNYCFFPSFLPVLEMYSRLQEQMKAKR